MTSKNSPGGAGMDGMDGISPMDGENSGLPILAQNNAGKPDPNDRGMPGISVRGQQQGMPQAGMNAAANAPAQEMPGGRMGADGGSGGAARSGGPGKISGGGTGGGTGDGTGGGAGDGTGVAAPRRRECGTMAVHRRLLSTSPAYARARDRIEDHARSYQSGQAAPRRAGVTRIPVVVHVVWNTAAQNVSDAQISSQIDVLNRDFRRTNPDASSTPAAFLPLATDARVEFSWPPPIHPAQRRTASSGARPPSPVSPTTTRLNPQPAGAWMRGRRQTI